MTKKFVHSLSTVVVLLFVSAPAMALNPQPLPPGRAAPRVLRDYQRGPRYVRRATPRAILRCHGIRGGDPRKPPVRVCP